NDKFFNIRVDQPSGGIDEVVIRGKMKFSSIKYKPMIWFDQNKLEQRLLKGELSDHHAFIYLLAQLALICVLLQLPFEESSLWYVWLLISLVVTVAGVSWSFRINQKGGDRDYLRRFIALSFVAIMRCLLLVFFISI